MVRICNENMANAIRIVTVEQGIDPREFALIAFGGAGATHACEIADAIGMRRVVVPPRPGLFSAFGALAAIVRVDAVRSVYLTDRTTSAGELDGLFGELEAQAQADVAAQGLAQQPEVRRFDRDALPGPELRAGGRRAGRGRSTTRRSREVYAEYGRLYEGFYGYRLDGIPIELVRLSVVAMGEPPVFAGLPSEDAEGEGPARRDVFFPETGFVATDIVRRERLAPGETRSRPAHRRVHGLDRRRPARLDALRGRRRGILDLTRA